ncbi:unnamed protein product [Closterium sp. NIES-64]|nr:unnamed protein product [Closterium sp. NIES-64]
MLVAFLATSTWQRAIASAKQLEGFDEDEFDDAADEEETEFVAPQRPPTRSIPLAAAGGRSAGQAADWDDEEFEGVTPGAGAGAVGKQRPAGSRFLASLDPRSSRRKRLARGECRLRGSRSTRGTSLRKGFSLRSS